MTSDMIALELETRLGTIRALSGLPIEKLELQAWRLPNGATFTRWTITGGGSHAIMCETESDAIAELAIKLRVNPREKAADKRIEAARLLSEAAALESIGGTP